ncbi:MAG TPA: maleylpyruvate isomerase N-terminal domain-containing protein [Candidatus Limnocylindrales bacterium]|nr:maleylpyruvate isomerase N-terminal domain-containing protein [Candidatus Limnocylindrales bacterium]
MSRIEALLAELTTEHDAFVTALEAVDVDLVTAPGVVEDWSVRDLIVHVAFWAEHATTALRLAADARGDEFAYDTAQTDAMNARLLKESQHVAPSAAVDREERAYDDLHAAVSALDPALLDVRLGNGDTVAEVIGYDGPEHYREHTAHLRAWFRDDDEGEGTE